MPKITLIKENMQVKPNSKSLENYTLGIFLLIFSSLNPKAKHLDEVLLAKSSLEPTI